MTLTTEPYLQSILHRPLSGQVILAHQHADQVVVYQAYKPSIANYAVKNQQLGGADFSYQRMSWIKPGFLWMMFRCGWAGKASQERVLALHLLKSDFEQILGQAVFAVYQEEYYTSPEEWRQQLQTREVRVQWDPDHDPYGNKLPHRAIQLGIKGDTLQRFGREQIVKVEDITTFVHQQYQRVREQQLQHLLVPVERSYTTKNSQAMTAVGAFHMRQE